MNNKEVLSDEDQTKVDLAFVTEIQIARLLQRLQDKEMLSLQRFVIESKELNPLYAYYGELMYYIQNNNLSEALVKRRNL